MFDSIWSDLPSGSGATALLYIPRERYPDLSDLVIVTDSDLLSSFLEASNVVMHDGRWD